MSEMSRTKKYLRKTYFSSTFISIGMTITQWTIFCYSWSIGFILYFKISLCSHFISKTKLRVK